MNARVLFALIPFVAATACSSSASSPSAPVSPIDGGEIALDGGVEGARVDGGEKTNPDASPDTSVADVGTECNSLSQQAQTAKLHKVTASEPAPTGGSLVDGTYALTDVTRYGLPLAEADGPFLQQITMQFSKGVADFVVTETIAGKANVTRSTSTVTTSGTKLTAVDTCPKPNTALFDYSASADGFDLFGTFLGLRMVEHFARID